jgi:hypothetical protein
MPEVLAVSIDSGRGEEEARVIIQAVVRALDFWGLSNREAADLFNVPSATWSRMKANGFKGRLDQDRKTRASLIIGIFKGLRLFFNGPLTYGWPKSPNSGPIFSGTTPAAYMIDGGIPAMLQVRRYVDGLRGGL